MAKDVVDFVNVEPQQAGDYLKHDFVEYMMHEGPSVPFATNGFFPAGTTPEQVHEFFHESAEAHAERRMNARCGSKTVINLPNDATPAEASKVMRIALDSVPKEYPAVAVLHFGEKVRHLHIHLYHCDFEGGRADTKLKTTALRGTAFANPLRAKLKAMWLEAGREMKPNNPELHVKKTKTYLWFLKKCTPEQILSGEAEKIATNPGLKKYLQTERLRLAARIEEKSAEPKPAKLDHEMIEETMHLMALTQAHVAHVADVKARETLTAAPAASVTPAISVAPTPKIEPIPVSTPTPQHTIEGDD